MNHEVATDHVILNVHMQAAPGYQDEVAEQLLALLAPTRAETGCVIYNLHRDPQDPAKFMFYEEFVSQAALDAHGETPHLQQFRQYRQAFPGRITSTATKWRTIA